MQPPFASQYCQAKPINATITLFWQFAALLAIVIQKYAHSQVWRSHTSGLVSSTCEGLWKPQRHHNGYFILHYSWPCWHSSLKCLPYIFLPCKSLFRYITCNWWPAIYLEYFSFEIKWSTATKWMQVFLPHCWLASITAALWWSGAHIKWSFCAFWYQYRFPWFKSCATQWNCTALPDATWEQLESLNFQRTVHRKRRSFRRTWSVHNKMDVHACLPWPDYWMTLVGNASRDMEKPQTALLFNSCLMQSGGSAWSIRIPCDGQMKC